MNIQDFKKLDQEQAFAEAGKIAGLPASVLDGMWRAESGRGKAMLSPAGAEGHFQLMPKTRASLEKQIGSAINPNDFHESLFAAATLMKENMAREGGNVANALRAYNNGPQWRKQLDPRGENAAYAQKVLGSDYQEDAAPQRQQQVATFATELPEQLLPRSRGKAQAELVTAPSFGPAVTTGGNPQPVYDSVNKAFADDQEAQKIGLIESSQRLFMHQGLVGAVLKAWARDPVEHDPSFVPNEEQILQDAQANGYDENQIEVLRQSGSQAMFDRYKMEFQIERDDMQAVAAGGTVQAFSAGLVAGLPEGAITGMGFAKLLGTAGLGAQAAARAGQLGRAAVLTVGENVGGNLVSATIEDAMTHRVSAHDYALNALMGAIVSPLSVPGLAAEARSTSRLTKMAGEYRAIQDDLVQRAQKNVGLNASAETLRAEVDRLEAKDIRDIHARLTGPVAEERKFPDVQKFLEDELAATKDAEVRKADTDAKVADDAAVVKEVEDMRTKEAAEADGIISQRGPGVHDFGQIDVSLNPARQAFKDLAKQFAPDVSFMFRQLDENHRASGSLTRIPGNTKEFVVNLKPRVNTVDSVQTAVHEFGHSLEYMYLGNASPEIQRGVESAYQRMAQALRSGDMDTALGMRFRAVENSPRLGSGRTKLSDEYIKSKSEFIAEQFAKYVQEDAVNYGDKVKITSWIKDNIASFVDKILNLFLTARKKAYIAPETELADFFDAIRQGSITRETSVPGRQFTGDHLGQLTGGKVQTNYDQPVDLSWLNDPIAQKFGLHMLPIDTPAQRAEVKSLIALYRTADDPKAVWNNLDPKALDRWFDNKIFDNVKSSSLRMLQSNNPVIRMVAAELLESPSGAAGRRSTASIRKYLNEKRYMGNVVNDFQSAYTEFRRANGGSVVDDFLDQDVYRRFNRAVAEEIENRGLGTGGSDASPAIMRAADSIEAAYERMRTDQVGAKVTGWASLPETSKGYMPHRMSAEAVRNMTRAQEGALYDALVDQFTGIEGWDLSFADKLAAKYIDRVRNRAMGGYDAPVGVSQKGAAEVVEDALTAMGMSKDEVAANMEKYMRGAAGHLKRRIKLDLTKSYDDPETGRAFTLMDFFETDQMNLLKQQAQRVSGETALTEHGVMGRPGLALLRRAAQMGYGADRVQGHGPEMEAFDQVIAEMLGDPYGTHATRNMDRIMQFTSLARLGGVVWNQIAESINMATTLGVGHAMDAIGSFGRLRSEALALARGEKVDGILSGIETWGGEFGVDHYRMGLPFESHIGENTVIGRDGLTAADRLLKGGAHAQAKLTGWRMVSAVQERGAAEQIVLKALRYIRDGGEDAALRDMGFTPSVVEAIKAEWPNIVKEQGGKFTGFDIQKMENKTAAEDFVQAVHRGSKQIIQGTFIGETGKYAHDGWLKLLTQFKSFGLVSVEKQWGRNVTNQGLVKAVAMLVGSMAAAAPIYMARMAVQAQGRPDKEKFLEERLHPVQIARATLNYVANAGMAGELLDALSAVSGVGLSAGGRTGNNNGLVGQVVAPSAGVVDDIYKSVQNSKDGTDIHGVVKNMPFANAPQLVPVMNLLKQER